VSALFRLLTSATSASLRFLQIGPKRASGEGCDEVRRPCGCRSLGESAKLPARTDRSQLAQSGTESFGWIRRGGATGPAARGLLNAMP
jgi:hypothetical protein